MPTRQQQAIYRQCKTARRMRAKFPPGTRVEALAGEPVHVTGRGIIQKHIPGTNAQGGYFVVLWDTGFTGRATPINIRKEGQS